MQSERAAAPAAPQSPSSPRCDRVELACKIVDLEQARRDRHASIRSVAAQNDTARSTLQDQLRATHNDGLPAAWQPFFESDVGVAFTLRLMITVLVIFVLRGGCSAELAAEFFEAMHLRRFVASSPTALRRLFAQILTHTATWGSAQRERLAKAMAPRDLVLALDENFHWDAILLGVVDVVTGFVFAERMSDTRDAEVWETSVRESLVGYNVCVRAITRDGATALGSCAERLGVPAGHDIFHIQYAVCGATARPMAQRVVRARAATQDRRDELAALRAERDRAQALPRGPGRPTGWAAHEARAVLAVEMTDQHAATMQAERDAMTASIRALGDVHHPVDLTTGAAVSAEQARERLQEAAEKLCEHAARASLGTRAIKALNGVFTRLNDLAAIVAWWHQEVRRQLDALSLPAVQVAWIESALVPALYVQHRIALGRNADERASLRALWARLRGELLCEASPWRTWDAETQRVVQRVVQSCVAMFPRSTSALEGHNGQDALVHHQRHQLSETFRTARLVVRNYVIERADGTTAAERLFGHKPGDLIEYLCGNLKLPGRGRLGNKRPKPPLLALTG